MRVNQHMPPDQNETDELDSDGSSKISRAAAPTMKRRPPRSLPPIYPMSRGFDARELFAEYQRYDRP